MYYRHLGGLHHSRKKAVSRIGALAIALSFLAVLFFSFWLIGTLYPDRLVLRSERVGVWGGGALYVWTTPWPVGALALFSFDVTEEGLVLNQTLIDPGTFIRHGFSGFRPTLYREEEVGRYEDLPPAVYHGLWLFQKGRQVALRLTRPEPEPLETGLLIGRPATEDARRRYVAGPTRLCEIVGRTVDCMPYTGGRIFYLASNGTLFGLTLEAGSARLVRLVKKERFWDAVLLHSFGRDSVPTSLSVNGDTVAASAAHLVSGRPASTLLVISGKGKTVLARDDWDVRGVTVLPDGLVAVAYVNSSGSYLEILDPARRYHAVARTVPSPFSVTHLGIDLVVVAGSDVNGAAFEVIRVERPNRILLLFKEGGDLLLLAAIASAALSFALVVRIFRRRRAVSAFLAVLLLVPIAPAQAQAPLDQDLLTRLDGSLRELESVLSGAGAYVVSSYLLKALDLVRDEPLRAYLRLLTARARESVLAGNVLEAEYLLYVVSRSLEIYGADRRVLLNSVRRGPYAAVLLPYLSEGEISAYIGEIERRSAEVGRTVEELRRRGYDVRFEVQVLSRSPALPLLALYVGIYAFAVYAFIADALIDRTIELGYALAGIRLTPADRLLLLSVDAVGLIIEWTAPLRGKLFLNEKLRKIIEHLNKMPAINTWYRIMDGSPFRLMDEFARAQGPVARREIADKVRLFCHWLSEVDREAICGVGDVAEITEDSVVEVLDNVVRGLQDHVDKWHAAKEAVKEVRKELLKMLVEDVGRLSAYAGSRVPGEAVRRAQLGGFVLDEMTYLVWELGPPVDLFRGKLYLLLFYREFSRYLQGLTEARPIVPMTFDVTAIENKHGCTYGYRMLYLLPPVMIDRPGEVEVDRGVRVRYNPLQGTYVVRVEDTMKCPAGHEEDPDYDDLVLHVALRGVNGYEVYVAYAERFWEMTATIGPTGRNVAYTNDRLLLSVFESVRTLGNFSYPELYFRVLD
ncbi:MAG: hypothetical protein QXP81_09475 [Nitrososphaerota archaeon]